MKKQISMLILCSFILCALFLVGCSAISVNDHELIPTTIQVDNQGDMEKAQKLLFDPPRTTNEAFLTVPGQTSPGNKIYINGDEITVSPEGTFTATLKLNEGPNIIVIKEVSPNARLQANKHIEYLPDIPVPELWVGLGDKYSYSHITFEGHTDPGCKVAIDGFPILVREDGSFVTDIIRYQGKHILNIVASNKEGKNTTIQKRISVVYPLKDPTLIVTLPEEPGFITSDRIVINGFTDPYCLVQVFNDYFNSNSNEVLSLISLSEVGSNGIFACEVTLNPGPNKLIIRTVNPAGRVKEEVRKIYFKNNENTSYDIPKGNGFGYDSPDTDILNRNYFREYDTIDEEDY